MKKQYVAIWFYFIPFIAIATNFFVPYIVARNNPVVIVAMNEDYRLWLENTLSTNETSDRTFIEPTLDEMLAMSNEVPFETDEW